MTTLNDKQKRFCEEYLIDLNATAAAIRAGYSEDTAYSQGQRLLKNVEIQKYVKEHQKNTSTKLNITRESQILFYENIKHEALSMQNYSASIKAAERQDKLLGLETPIKTETDHIIKSYVIKPASSGTGTSD